MNTHKSARLFRNESLECALVLGSAHKGSQSYGDELKTSIVNNNVQFEIAVERVLQI
jgi:hypothetical protein